MSMDFSWLACCLGLGSKQSIAHIATKWCPLVGIFGLTLKPIVVYGGARCPLVGSDITHHKLRYYHKPWYHGISTRAFWLIFTSGLNCAPWCHIAGYCGRRPGTHVGEPSAQPGSSWIPMIVGYIPVYSPDISMIFLDIPWKSSSWNSHEIIEIFC